MSTSDQTADNDHALRKLAEVVRRVMRLEGLTADQAADRLYLRREVVARALELLDEEGG
jgi:hypothetical protein